jgi:hypothetical protein
VPLSGGFVHRFFAILVILAFVFGASYASALLFRAMGPWTAVGVESDGSTIHMAFGPDLPRPDWVPIYPGAVVVQSSRLTSGKMPSGFHSLDLATRASFEDVKRFYIDRLTASGFTVVDNGVAPLNPLTAAYLGIAGSLSGRRVASDDQIEIMIRISFRRGRSSSAGARSARPQSPLPASSEPHATPPAGTRTSARTAWHRPAIPAD